MRVRWPTGLALTALIVLHGEPTAVTLVGQRDTSAPPGPTTVLDVVVLDDAGRAVTNLAATDLRVAIDGEPRPVISVRYLFRGTGAVEAARAAASTASTLVAAEPSRVVLVGVDEGSFHRGSEKAVVSALGRLGDVLAPGDRAGFLALPQAGAVALGVDRQPFRQAMARVRGRAPERGPSTRTADHRGAEDDLRVADAAPMSAPDTGRERVAQPAADRSARPPPDPRLEETAPRDTTTISRSSIAILADQLAGLRDVPGPKTAIYVWGGIWSTAWPEQEHPYDPGNDVDRLVSIAAASRTAIHAVEVLRSNRARPDVHLERLARETGGTLSRVDDEGTWSGQLSAAMSRLYLVEVAVDPRDRDPAGRTRSLAVTSRRQDVVVLAARKWTARDDPLPPPVEAAVETTASDEAAGTRPTPRAAAGRDAELDVVMARAAQYLDAYLHEFSNVVTEEEYKQESSSARIGGRGTETREIRTVHLRSDLLLLRPSERSDWIPFRDVFEVNGRPVRDREDRLRKLFLENPDTAVDEARRIALEGSRFNLGSVERTVNTPTVGLFFLLPEHRSRLRLTRRGEETIEGVRAWKILFEEVQGPTVIAEARTGKDIPSTGTLWVDPASGRVVKTHLKCRGRDFGQELTVTYRPSETLGIWAPAQMKEFFWARYGAYAVSGVARYSKYRRFQVTTDEQVAVPKS